MAQAGEDTRLSLHKLNATPSRSRPTFTAEEIEDKIVDAEDKAASKILPILSKVAVDTSKANFLQWSKGRIALDIVYQQYTPALERKGAKSAEALATETLQLAFPDLHPAQSQSEQTLGVTPEELVAKHFHDAMEFAQSCRRTINGKIIHEAQLFLGKLLTEVDHKFYTLGLDPKNFSALWSNQLYNTTHWLAVAQAEEKIFKSETLNQENKNALKEKTAKFKQDYVQLLTQIPKDYFLQELKSVLFSKHQGVAIDEKTSGEIDKLAAKTVNQLIHSKQGADKKLKDLPAEEQEQAKIAQKESESTLISSFHQHALAKFPPVPPSRKLIFSLAVPPSLPTPSQSSAELDPASTSASAQKNKKKGNSNDLSLQSTRGATEQKSAAQTSAMVQATEYPKLDFINYNHRAVRALEVTETIPYRSMVSFLDSQGFTSRFNGGHQIFEREGVPVFFNIQKIKREIVSLLKPNKFGTYWE